MRKTMLFLIIICLITIIAAIPSQAEVTMRDYDKVKDSKWFKDYIYGVGIGYKHANVELWFIGQPKLYCEPKKLVLGASNYIDILEREIQSSINKYTLKTPVELILLQGLKKTFPCIKQ